MKTKDLTAGEKRISETVRATWIEGCITETRPDPSLSSHSGMAFKQPRQQWSLIMQQEHCYLAAPRDCSTSLQQPPPPIWSTLGGQPQFSWLELRESPGMMGRWATGHLEQWWWTEGIAFVRIRQTTRQNPQISHWTEFLLALPSLQGIRKVSTLHHHPHVVDPSNWALTLGSPFLFKAGSINFLPTISHFLFHSKGHFPSPAHAEAHKETQRNCWPN